MIRIALLAALTAVTAGCSAPALNGPSATGSGADGCFEAGRWHRLGGDGPVAVSGHAVLTRAADQAVVLLGEQHTSADDHRWQLQTLAALHVRHPDMVIGFESFPRRLQPVLDKWVAGKLTAEQFLDKAQWHKVWNYPARFYLPLFQFARINRIPMIALNVDTSLPRAVRKHGWEAVPASEKEGVSRPAAPTDAYVDMLFEVHQQHALSGHGSGEVTRSDPRFRHFVQAQMTWDRAMAEALAAHVSPDESGEDPLVVGIMGAGHMRHGHGVPHQLEALGIDRVATLLAVDAGRDCESLGPDYADAVFALPDQPTADKAKAPSKPRLGVLLGAVDAVHIVRVLDDSLAERTGFQAGDEFVSIAGTEVTGMQDVISAVDEQPPGTWLPVTIRRDGEVMKLVIKFPPGQ